MRPTHSLIGVFDSEYTDVMANAVIEGRQGESLNSEVEEQDVSEEATTIEQVVAEEETETSEEVTE